MKIVGNDGGWNVKKTRIEFNYYTLSLVYLLLYRHNLSAKEDTVLFKFYKVAKPRRNVKGVLRLRGYSLHETTLNRWFKFRYCDFMSMIVLVFLYIYTDCSF